MFFDVGAQSTVAWTSLRSRWFTKADKSTPTLPVWQG